MRWLLLWCRDVRWELLVFFGNLVSSYVLSSCEAVAPAKGQLFARDGEK